MIENLPATKCRIQKIRKHQEQDTIVQQVSKFSYVDGQISRMNIPNDIKLYYSVSSELSVKKGLLLRGSRIVNSHSAGRYLNTGT